MNILKLERSIALLKPIIWDMPINEKRNAYITLWMAAQKQIPQELSPLLSDDGLRWKCPVCGKLVDDDAHYCKYCGQAICND